MFVFKDFLRNISTGDALCFTSATKCWQSSTFQCRGRLQSCFYIYSLYLCLNFLAAWSNSSNLSKRLNSKDLVAFSLQKICSLMRVNKLIVDLIA